MKISDSGQRRQFESGAVRDIQEGKGRCDLLPLDVVASLMDNQLSANIINHIGQYMMYGHDEELYLAIREFNLLHNWSTTDCILEVSRHYEDGCNKYGERNWERGIDIHSYIDSGVRHFLKYLAGQDDERHDRAFVWNLLGAIWTQRHRPDLIDLPFNMKNPIYSASTTETDISQFDADSADNLYSVCSNIDTALDKINQLSSHSNQ